LSLDELEERVGYRFENRALLRQAVTHTSYANEQGLNEHNQRLEFLGDSVLGLIAADRLYRSRPAAPEGELSLVKSHVVNDEALARCARRLDLGAALRLGHGEERSGGRDKQSLLACALEAVIGAVYVDGGLEAARNVVEPWVDFEAAETLDLPDAKSDLQERLQARGLPPPVYRHIGREGPDHDPIFHVECLIDSEIAASATGHSKKAAERRAARRALVAFTGA
jgi:ribonuclease-3